MASDYSLGQVDDSLRAPAGHEHQLLTAIQGFSSEDAVRVQEFTTALDDRMLLATMGFFRCVGVLTCGMMDDRPLTNPIVL